MPVSSGAVIATRSRVAAPRRRCHTPIPAHRRHAGGDGLRSHPPQRRRAAAGPGPHRDRHAPPGEGRARRALHQRPARERRQRRRDWPPLRADPRRHRRRHGRGARPGPGRRGAFDGALAGLAALDRAAAARSAAGASRSGSALRPSSSAATCTRSTSPSSIVPRFPHRRRRPGDPVGAGERRGLRRDPELHRRGAGHVPGSRVRAEAPRFSCRARSHASSSTTTSSNT